MDKAQPSLSVSPEILKYGEIEDTFESAMSRVFFVGQERPVVVKGLLPEADYIAKARLCREAAVLGKLAHPQLPELIEDKTAEEVPYFVMTRKDGAGDITVLDDFSNPEFAAKIIYSALTPLGYLHGQEFVHRDLTKKNLVVDWSGSTSVIDLGIVAARAYSNRMEAGEFEEGSLDHIKLRDHYLSHPSLTSPDSIVGTIPYMSPERLKGTRADITSDIYSLGIVLYELLYGRLPFNGQHSSEVSVAAQIVHWHMEGPVNFHVPKDRKVPVELISIIERAVQKQPEDRYQSAEEMQEDIARYLYT